MKVRVVCRNYGTAVREKTVWRGDLDSVPRKGEQIYLSGDGPVKEVQDVGYDLVDGCVHVWLDPDYRGAFRDWDNTPYYGVDGSE